MRAPQEHSEAPSSGCGGDSGHGVIVMEAPALERHPWELPLLALAIGVTLAVPAVLVPMLWTGAATAWTGAIGAALLTAPAAWWAVRGLRHAEQRAQSVRVSPTQFPEAYTVIEELSATMDLHCTPDAYVHPGGRRRSGASASGHGRRRYIVLAADHFELGGRLGDPEALRFLIAHQLGHIAAGHTSFWLRISCCVGAAVPVLGPALSRAMEYTADDHALAHCPEGAHAVRLPAGGKHLYPDVSMGEMAERGRRDRGGFLFLYNLMSSSPVNIKRIAAVRDRSRPGRLFF